MKDKFAIRLVIMYLITYLYGLIVGIIPLFNPYIFLTFIYGFLIWISYGLMTINLALTFIYVIKLFRSE